MPSKKSSKQWLHPPEALTKGHILYTIKFLGECKVDQPKGTEVVKDAIRKMKFNKHLKRAEGIKSAKVNLTVSAEAVMVIDPKTKVVVHQYPLHRISYCADDKSDKRMFTFIAKDAHSNDHYCYVFDSEKCAEEITLTIGQAFDLAYRQFLDVSNAGGDLRRQCVLLQKKVQVLTQEKEALAKRLMEVEKLKDRDNLEEYKRKHQITDITSPPLKFTEGKTGGKEEDATYYSTEIEPSQEVKGQDTTVGRRLENLVLTDKPLSQNGRRTTDVTAPSQHMPVLSPPPPNSRPVRSPPAAVAKNDNSMFFSPSLTSTNPFINQGPVDPFGMEAFSPGETAGSTLTAGSGHDFVDMQDGFSRGLAFGAEDFNLSDLDPLGKRV